MNIAFFDVKILLWILFIFVYFFYSFDRRRADDGKRWSADQPFGNRAYFQENPYISHLIIKEVRKEVSVIYILGISKNRLISCLSYVLMIP